MDLPRRSSFDGSSSIESGALLALIAAKPHPIDVVAVPLYPLAIPALALIVVNVSRVVPIVIVVGVCVERTYLGHLSTS
jgi:hypothetical protein